MSNLLIGVSSIAILFSSAALAQQGTAADAKAMLDKTVMAIKADKAKAIAEINKGGDYLKGDIYPFCFNLSDGLLVAVANQNAKGNLGKDERTQKDATGDNYGARLYAARAAGTHLANNSSN